ncbi:hypothetical protein [Legionella bononiensis]|uniref:Tetratricopeptide repeat protein n=1 Tax=Legionella bononiensis TaxID=2793102 RepID=A0ABS1W9K2_9GAMM|nr:hypothetical protein [Legionella bononiensis]MBL7480759.1 hypothetical protein [Legionella bononiensis]MBL7526042.1 hypothetical protein [Legionella bononiensis]MBL7563463.1 hypothetical protein [Legionella bononiensis]
MLRIKLGSHTIRRYKERGIVYRPDFIIYDIDEAEYRRFWEQIKKHPKGQLYTDGIQVFRVSWLQSLFQSLKGWLGFENHCQANKVEMTLAKIAYQGYLKGFHAPNQFKFDPPIISDRFESLLNEPRENRNSTELQQLLMSYYITHSDQITHWGSPVHLAFPFGQTLLSEELYQFIPSIDAQDDSVILSAIDGLHYRFKRLELRECMKNSHFAELYATYLVGQEQYLEALNWHEEIKNQFVEEYIDFYLPRKHSLFNALKYAIELIETLFQSPRIEDKNKSVAYIKKHMSTSEQLTHLEPDSELRKFVAQSYLQDAKKEKSKFPLTKLLFGTNFITLLAQAVRLAPDILDQDHSMQDIVLKEEWITYLFNEAIKDRDFKEATSLFESHTNIKFDKNNLNVLKSYYLTKLAENQETIREELEHMNFPTAEDAAKQNIYLAQQIARISPQDNPLIPVTIDYAGTLIDIDKKMFPDVKEASLEQLNEAQKVLDSCNLSKNVPQYKQRYNELLLRKIECIIEKIRVPIDFNDSLSVRKEFVPQIKPWLDLLHQNLSSFITLNEQKPGKDIRAVLGKIYYIKGDLIHFYTRNRQEALPYFKKAAEVMSENPYYRLRYYELAEDERRHDVRDEIENMAYLNTTKYTMWMEERWNETRFMSEGFDIHDIEPVDNDVLSRLSRIFGS